MIDVIESRLYRWRALAPWLVVEAALHGAAVVALLLWLSYRFLTEGFGDIRQHALAPSPARASLSAAAQRKWWACRCEGACECLTAFARGVRACCERLLARVAF